MRTLHEQDGERTAADLAEAWSSPETFALLPRKTGAPAAWLERALEALPPALQRDHFGLLTSGTTGMPKLLIGSRRRAEALARVLHEAQDSEPVEESIAALPLAYSYAFVNQWLWARIHERRLVTTQGLRAPEELLAALDGARAAMLCLVPAQLSLLLEHAGEQRPFAGVIRVHFAGARFPEAQLGALRRLFPQARVFNNYGCAEAMPRLCLRALDAEGGARAGDVGRPLPGVELELGASSELSFRSPFRAVAQISESDGFRTIDDDEWLPTGDLAKQASSGRWEIAGRANEIFKRYGEKVSIPNVLAAIAEVYSGELSHHRAEDRGGEQGYVLVVCPAPTAPGLTAILRTLRERYARSHWPLRIESVETMPLLPNGKPDARVLAAGATPRVTHWDQRV